eukprot:gnl/TRDRNA2_/TRDRNA2_173007_c0_seq1.p1 gnl/TRDRNA2_/TRDRNA2_173007_c0~~gnl/TRDRNA2_/TRDRNA2_173007_c0_seq1.p1  ORF type:complete len:183 (-),score=15.47 gnl/TRDRNA2_/TRDRNA2_173007_c0_seq1:16-498(-)
MKCSEPLIIMMSAAALLLCSLMLHGCGQDKDKNHGMENGCKVCEVWELGKCKVRKESTSCEPCEDLGITDESTCDTACKQKNVNASHGTFGEEGTLSGGRWEQGCMFPDDGPDAGCMILCRCSTGGFCESTHDGPGDDSCEEQICAPRNCMGMETCPNKI